MTEKGHQLLNTVGLYWSNYRFWQSICLSFMYPFSVTSANIAINHILLKA